MISFKTVIQEEQLGLGHAILCAEKLIGDENFGVILGDDLILSKRPVLGQLMDISKKNGNGSIINVSSISGIIGQPAIQPVYNASKGAVRIFTKSTAVQYGKFGIRANSIHPGGVDTDMIAHITEDDERQQRIKETVPLQRIADPIEIAYGALFLASDESSFMTGSEMVIDGGVTAS